MKPTILKRAGWFFLVGILLLHAVLAWNWRDYLPKGYSDFAIFYTAGKIMRDGPRSHLYDGHLQFAIQRQFASQVKNRQAALPYNHPPFEALLFVPLTWFGYFDAYLIWNLFNLACLWGISLLLRSQVSILRSKPLWLWSLVSLAFFPIFMTLIEGQDSILLLLTFTLVFVNLKKGADFAAGCYLALGLFRFHLVIPLALVFLLKAKRSAVLGFAMVACLLFVLSIGLVGWDTAIHYPQYVIRLEAEGAGGAIAPANMPTIHGLLDPLIGTQFGKLASAGVVGVISVVILLVAMLNWRTSEQDDFDLQFSLVLLITVLVAYHAYAHDLSLLLLPILLVANYLDRGIFKLDKLSLRGPVFLLFLSPLYMVLWFRLGHLNFLALLLLWWTWGLWRELHPHLSAESSGVL